MRLLHHPLGAVGWDGRCYARQDLRRGNRALGPPGRPSPGYPPIPRHSNTPEVSTSDLLEPVLHGHCSTPPRYWNPVRPCRARVGYLHPRVVRASSRLIIPQGKMARADENAGCVAARRTFLECADGYKPMASSLWLETTLPPGTVGVPPSGTSRNRFPLLPSATFRIRSISRRPRPNRVLSG